MMRVSQELSLFSGLVGRGERDQWVEEPLLLIVRELFRTFMMLFLVVFFFTIQVASTLFDAL